MKEMMEANLQILNEVFAGCSFEGERWKLETNGVYFVR